MRFQLTDPGTGTFVVWENGEISGEGPAYRAARNAFILNWPFLLTVTGPEITPDMSDPLSAYLTIGYYAFPDIACQEEGVPPGILRRVNEMTGISFGAVS